VIIYNNKETEDEKNTHKKSFVVKKVQKARFLPAKKTHFQKNKNNNNSIQSCAQRKTSFFRRSSRDVITRLPALHYSQKMVIFRFLR
jgi:hypothetical protein